MDNDYLCPLTATCPNEHCCIAHWADVPELRALMPGVDVQNNTVPCPNLGPEGCRLSREEQPYRCKAYLCEEGKSALEGKSWL